ncbi:MAG: class I SAM-dependent methyltransferase [Rhodospirillaceae bacterium]
MREQDIRPADLLEEYLRLSAEDAAAFFAARERFVHRACPGCGAGAARHAFSKNGFDLVRCGECDTLYANPIPDDGAFAKFYRGSPSQRYWAEVFFPAVAEARRERIFRRRVEQLKDMLAPATDACETVIDVGAGAGIFLEECRSLGLGRRHVAVEPSVELAATCRGKGFETAEGMVEDIIADGALAGSADLVTCFEVIEHVASPARLLSDLAALCRPGGTILATGLCGTGFDILVLGQRANAVSPPHHINFLSRTGALALMRRSGLADAVFRTPGQLDVDIVANTLARDGETLDDPFLAHLMAADDTVKSAFQSFLAENGLSSHMWLIARKGA